MRRSSPPSVNLYTPCTGMRSGRFSGLGTGTKASICSSTVGPKYHGVRSLRMAMLSPSMPLTGMNAAGEMLILARNSVNSVTMER